MDGKQIITSLLQAEANQDIELMADRLADNVVYETPFVLPGVANRIEGKEQLLRLLTQFIGKERGIYATWSIFNINVYAAEEPDLFFAEMQSKGTVAKSGYVYEQSYVSLFRVQADRVIEWREYFNPLPLQEAMASIQA
ncbi:nuclear transport factor 2 family protein [Paenibacillus sp. YIM B09110]|uniref:nuclear transport factor 2 family protein n=1 Tax=Paenibacillus sp. YIM B09110 TaxID=3126102 RepID=UPI00301C6E56